MKILKRFTNQSCFEKILSILDMIGKILHSVIQIKITACHVIQSKTVLEMGSKKYLTDTVKHYKKKAREKGKNKQYIKTKMTEKKRLYRRKVRAQ